MNRQIKKIWDANPYLIIVVTALTVRLIAAVFARGYGMHDDHFCVIETAQNWIDGIGLPGADNPSLRNLFYTGMHFILFGGLERLGIYDPQAKMFVVRLIHALYSLLAVWFGIKITEEISDKRKAKAAGILLALFWLLPFMSVRNLVEIVCIPPLMVFVYLSIKNNQEKEALYAIAAGAAAGIAFALRYQTAPFIGTVGLLLLMEKKWTRLTGMIIGLLTTAAIILGIPEIIVYGKPFATFAAYLLYNAGSPEVYGYPTNVWYTYLGTILGLLIPPSSLILLSLFLSEWKNGRYQVFPTLAFLLFHSLYPNKQERFIFPVIPFILMCAAAGEYRHFLKGKFTPIVEKAYKWSWRWFWVVNTILLAVTVVTYSKKTRVEAMSFFYDKPEVRAIVINDEESTIPMMPVFYMGRSCEIYHVGREKPPDSLQSYLDNRKYLYPDYILYMGEENLEERIGQFKSIFPSQEFVKKIDPSFIDNLLFAMNPKHNINKTVSIYSIPGKK